MNIMQRGVEEILNTISGLPIETIELLRNRISMMLSDKTSTTTPIIEYRKEIQENAQFVCPHCGCDDIIGHGNFKGRKRYKCKGCRKTFNDLSGTSIDKLHKKELWSKYVQCVSEGLTLREAAKESGISYRTSFIWRHKILASLKDIGCYNMEGIVEADETFFLSSEKGNRNIPNRKPRKRGGKATKRGINDEHITVIVSTDRHGEFIAEVTGKGRLTTKQIDAKIGKWIGSGVDVICTDSHRSYEGFAKKKKLKHVKINASKGQHVKDKIYHIQNINSAHGMIKDWMHKFRGGVGDSYLQNYMNWYRVQRKIGVNQEEFIRYALTSNNAFIAGKNIKTHYIIS